MSPPRPVEPAVSEPAPAGVLPIVLSGFASIDRILQTPPHPVEARYHRGEATLAELLEVPGIDEDSGVTIEETSAWLRGEAPGCILGE
jgi:hypothetical protein